MRLHLSENSIGPAPGASQAIRDALATLTTYPDPTRADLVHALARHTGTHPDQVAVGNGTDELLLMIALRLVDPVQGARTTSSTFPGYAICCEVAGRPVHTVPLQDLAVDPVSLVADLPPRSTVFVCNPHNPTGSALDGAAMSALARAVGEGGGVLVVDEAYLEFATAAVPSALDMVRRGERVVCLRTFSKAWGLAAVRVGYCVGPVDLVERIRSAQAAVPFSVNGLALRAAAAALRAPEHLEQVAVTTRRRRDLLSSGLAAQGFRVRPSETNFVLVEHPESTRAAAALGDAGVLVRDCAAFGLAGHLRISAGTPEQIQIALDALATTTNGATT